MFLFIDKPKGLTSHAVVNALRKITGEKKVGHAGTLDPNATGLLIVGVGRESTKKLSKISTDDKVYYAEIYLGEEKDTDDVEGKTTFKKEINSPPPESLIKEIMASFEGESSQTPPAFSAIKIKGKKAYELARKGKKPNLKPRKVTIYKIKIISYKYPVLKLRVKVSKGTYIRSLARDLGRKLEVGAYLKNLRREKINGFSVKDAVKLKDLTAENFKDFEKRL